MEVKRCEKGHFYDGEVHSACPQCAAEKAAAQGAAPAFGAGDYGPTEPVDGLGGGMAGMADFGVTEPQSPFGRNDPGETQPVTGGSGFTGGNFDMPGMPQVDDYDSVTEPVNVGGVAGFSPVVGWLVCIEGPARGTDYRIQAGYNYIGRAEHMDICVRGDMKIGREKHALIAYDQEERVFFFGPADGKSIVRLNGKMVMNPQEIHSHDVIMVGSTKLMFVPLCGERFDWND